MKDPLSEDNHTASAARRVLEGISGAGRWGVRYSDFGQPSFRAVLEGSCRLAVDGHRALTLEAGDFVLLPATPGFTLSGFQPVKPKRIDPKVTPAPTGEVRHGTRGGHPDVRLLGSYFVFDSPDAALLVSLLPTLVHVRGVERLSLLVRLVGEDRANGDQAATSCSRASSRCCSSKRCGRLRAKMRLRVCCARWPMRDSRKRYGRCTAIPHARGRWPSSRRRPRFSARRSSIASRAPLACRRWNTCSPGAWPSRRICSVATTWARRGRRARRLRLSEHFQHGVQPARGPASRSLCAQASGRRVNATSPIPGVLKRRSGSVRPAGPCRNVIREPGDLIANGTRLVLGRGVTLSGRPTRPRLLARRAR